MWPVNIVRGMHTSVFRCQQTTCIISQGLHRSDAACEHLASYVSQWHTPLANAITHAREIYVSWRWSWKMKCTWTNACMHDVWCALLPNNVVHQNASSDKAWTYQQCKVDINRATSLAVWAHRTCNISWCTSAKKHFPMRRNNIQDLYESVMACVHQLGNIGRGLRIGKVTSSSTMLQPSHDTSAMAWAQ